MQLSDLPARIRTAFATSGAKNTIPETTVTPGAAAYDVGFPALTMLPLTAGGVPPSGQDFNGVFYAMTLIQRWQSAGGSFTFDATWAAANSGYPKGAVLLRSDGTGFWLNTTEANATDPESGVSTGWVPSANYGVTALSGLTNANVTLTAAQAAKSFITLAGALTGNVQILVPNWIQPWNVANNTTGAFTVTVKTAAGGGVVIPQGGIRSVFGDGTDVLTARTAGSLVSVQVLITSGTYIRSAGAVSGRVRLIGGGSGGGGSTTSPVGQICMGAGGGGGAYGEHFFNGNLPASQAFTIGAGGAAGAAGSGSGAGGTTIFGALSAPGAVGSTAALPGIPPVFLASAPGGVAGSGCNMVNSGGFAGAHALGVTTGSFVSGVGGGTPLGGGAACVVSNTANGQASPTRGGGGSGGANGSDSPGQPGGTGGAGIIIIEEFA